MPMSFSTLPTKIPGRLLRVLPIHIGRDIIYLDELSVFIVKLRLLYDGKRKAP